MVAATSSTFVRAFINLVIICSYVLAYVGRENTQKDAKINGGLCFSEDANFTEFLLLTPATVNVCVKLMRMARLVRKKWGARGVSVSAPPQSRAQ